jgi:hypothetical protein
MKLNMKNIWDDDEDHAWADKDGSRIEVDGEPLHPLGLPGAG